MKSNPYGKIQKRAFTLIELLVVIAVIAVLMGILMPALSRARELGKRANCMSNLKNLNLIWTMYADDHEGRLPSGGNSYNTSMIWHKNGRTGYTTREGQEKAIRQGVLWPYASENLGVYRCPTAPKEQAHTYIMPDSYANHQSEEGLANTHGAPLALILKHRDDIKRPSERMTFLDEGHASPQTWSIFYNAPRWWDPVPIRHGNGTTIAMADGHVEYWKWSDPRTIEFGIKANDLEDPDKASYWRKVQPNNDDITRLVKSIWGQVGWR